MPFDVIAAALTAVLVGLTLLGLAVRFVLLPWLRDHLVDPVKETNHQVTANHHSSPTPTVLDRLEDVADEVRALALMFDGHLDWSQREVDRIWRRLRATEGRKH